MNPLGYYNGNEIQKVWTKIPNEFPKGISAGDPSLNSINVLKSNETYPIYFTYHQFSESLCRINLWDMTLFY